jgi:hypothetical protein
MRKLTQTELKQAQRAIDNTLEKGMRRAIQRRQRSQEFEIKRMQRAKYRSGAAQSPTPPPKPNLERDELTLKILSAIEREAIDSRGYILVEALAEKFLNEQDLLDPALATVPLTSFNDLVDRLSASSDPELEKTLTKRLKLKEQLMRQKVSIYGWDKCTYLLRSCFISWAMNPQTVVPFTTNLSAEAIEGAKQSKTGFASHLQDRLRKIIKRKLNGQVPDFWFAVEKGSKFGFHLHGAMACGTNPRIQAKVKEALHSFSGLGSGKTVMLSAPGPRLRWSEYCSKHSVTTRKLIKGDTFACTMGCRRQGKEMYEAFREELRELNKA